MDECIKRKAALEECDWYANEFCECEYAIMPLKGALENLPAADVRPVVRGKWKHDEDGLVWCHNCGFGKERSDERAYHFCPNCGADMREES